MKGRHKKRGYLKRPRHSLFFCAPMGESVGSDLPLIREDADEVGQRQVQSCCGNEARPAVRANNYKTKKRALSFEPPPFVEINIRLNY